MTSPRKTPQTESSRNDSIHGRTSFSGTFAPLTENSTSEQIDGTKGVTFHHEAHPWDERTLLRRYFIEAGGPRYNYLMDLATVELLTTEFCADDINPFEILDLHQAVLQLCASTAEAANVEASARLDEDRSLLRWRIG
ncbi:hypothetical protein BMJ29_36925 [Sinorhizobium medicae]|uniref:Uncharacterized protein n=1 Tax=Sinorhizobium medicae TaxID=110321 RepID=A0ABX4TAM5_9HYPH|nr:hypothetical protein BMJ33_35220 [Sinorhizobium medicae]PLU10447.1 hypothetical protein BMJ29_36925 [Sinorhizobium medicae]PLU77863.1 hypothetical protein BMJ19_21760 [Sinorhizobium medicae]